MPPRTTLSAADLFVLLDREYRRRRPQPCTECYVQLPYRVETRDASRANWEMSLPVTCGNGCREVLDGLVVEYQERYDLTGPVAPAN